VLASSACLVAFAAQVFDVAHVELDVVVHDRDLAVTATPRAAGAPERCTLELVPEMKVTSVLSGSASVPFTVSQRVLTLDLSRVQRGDGAFELTIRCEGAPSEKFAESQGGYVRSIVAPELGIPGCSHCSTTVRAFAPTAQSAWRRSFRLGHLEEAEKELLEALRLGAGGPFHRGWVHLRLGCVADLRGDRKAALEHYGKVAKADGSSKAAAEKAKSFLDKAYRGFAKDG
jgi:hypothetical protein